MEPTRVKRKYTRKKKLNKSTKVVKPKVNKKNKSEILIENKLVKAGDLVILHTGIGTPSETSNEDGTKNHFFIGI